MGAAVPGTLALVACGQGKGSRPHVRRIYPKGTRLADTLTREQILTMPAGRVLDVLVNIAVTGLDSVPKYSEDISHAWSVVECLAGKNVRLVLEDWRTGKGIIGGWAALFSLPNGHDTGHALGETAPLAICRAAALLIALEAPPCSTGSSTSSAT